MKGKTVLVTGSSRGIGLAVADLFLEKGSRVVVSARGEEELRKAAAQLRVRHGEERVISMRSDVGDPESIRALFAAVDSHWGPVDVLVNNAAIGYGQDFFRITPQDFDQLFAVNVRGTFFCAQEMMRRAVAASRPGFVVNLSSLGGIQGTEKFKGLSVYTATKFAVVGLTEALAVEGKEHGIRVNCVAPGAVDTEMLRKAAPHLKTNTSPADVALVIHQLCVEAETQGTTGKIVEIHSNIQ